MTEFRIGDRVGAKAAVRKKYEVLGNTKPLYGHIVSIRGQSLIWVRDHTGGTWGLPASELEYID